MRLRQSLRSLGTFTITIIVTLAVLEMFLRAANFRELREGVTERSLSYSYDAELGWFPVPGSSARVTNARTVSAHHNSMGLRDVEFTRDATPTIMFLGDSFVWGLDAEAGERFTELLKPRIPGRKILAAGVSGFGTDQEYLMLKKLWPQVEPAVVVLIVCTDNDRSDNSTNIRYEDYQKPYFSAGPDGALVLRGQPVPRSRLQAIKEDFWVHNVFLVRLAHAVYMKLSHPVLFVPDPTERLIDMIREFVESKGAKFLVGLQWTDAALVRHLQEKRIPFVTFDGADAYPGASVGRHWTPEGHKLVAERLLVFLRENGAIGAGP
jgi:hypothetical protein